MFPLCSPIVFPLCSQCVPAVFPLSMCEYPRPLVCLRREDARNNRRRGLQYLACGMSQMNSQVTAIVLNNYKY